jgi:hypothetical protein
LKASTTRDPHGYRCRLALVDPSPMPDPWPFRPQSKPCDAPTHEPMPMPATLSATPYLLKGAGDVKSDDPKESKETRRVRPSSQNTQDQKVYLSSVTHDTRASKPMMSGRTARMEAMGRWEIELVAYYAEERGATSIRSIEACLYMQH